MEWLIGLLLLLFAFLFFPRQMVAISAAIATVVAGAWLWNYFENERSLQQRREELAAVKVSVVYDKDVCDTEYPLSVTLTNSSKRTLLSVTFEVNGYRRGYSTPLYRTGDAGYKSDRIILGGDSWVECWTLPRAYGTPDLIESNPPDRLVWIATNPDPIFARSR